MKSKIRIFVSVLILMSVAYTSFAAGLPGFYTVDYKLLLALHPKMSNYDLILGRHLKRNVNFSDMKLMSQLNQKIAALGKVAHKKVAIIQTKIIKLQAESDAISEKIGKTVSEFNEKRGQFRGSRTKQFQMQKYAKLQNQISIEKQRIQQTWDEVLNPLYLSRAESKKIIKQALNEIDSVLNQLSQKYGGAVIIDSDFMSSQITPHRITSSPEVGADPLSVRVYQALLQSDNVAEVPEPYKTDPELKLYAASMQTQMDKGFNENIARQISKQPLYGYLEDFHGRLFLTGNEKVDLTRQALAMIFQRNRVSQAVASRILSLIK